MILLGVTPHSLTRTAARNEHLRKYLEKPSSEAAMRDLFGPLLDGFAPVDWVRLLSWRRFANHPVERAELRENGFASMGRHQGKVEEALTQYAKAYRTEPVSRELEDQLIATVASWHDRGYRVLIFEIPTTPEMEALERTESGLDFKWLREGLRAAGAWVMPRELGSSYVTCDGSHLTAESAQRFSLALGKELRKMVLASSSAVAAPERR